jgi:putative tryptophan/tyrosine transport system substrate-binding protein
VIARRAISGTLALAVAVGLMQGTAAQRMPVIGFLHAAAPETSDHIVAALREGLGEAGYVEGRNVAIEHRWAHDQYGKLPDLAAELVRLQVAVIVTGGTAAARAARTAAEAGAIPVVFASGADPVRAGLVASLNKPGGNLTGISGLTDALIVKRLELLREMVPPVAKIAVLLNSSNPNAEVRSADLLRAGESIGRELNIVTASTEGELDEVFAVLARQGTGALLVQNDAFFTSRRERLVQLAARHAIPAIYERSEFAKAGGLISYGPSLSDTFRQAGVYAGRILDGAKPGELPVLQPTKFELVINLKAAKALGLAISPALLARADEVIE